MSPRPRKLGKFFLFVAVLGAVSLPQQAGADPYDSCYGSNSDGGCRPDDFNHTFCQRPIMNDYLKFKDASAYAMRNLDSQTRYTRYYKGDCDHTVDVKFGIDTSVSGVRGYYECNEYLTDGVGGTLCGGASVYYNPPEINNNDRPELNREKTACHEVGHSGGLTHHASPYSDCLVNGEVASGHRDYNEHHVEHLNNNY